MRGRCDNPKCGRGFGLQAVAKHWTLRFCSKACKTQYKHDLVEEKKTRRAVRDLFAKQ